MYSYINFFLPMLFGWFCAQAPKFTYKMIRYRPKDWFGTLVSSGGMPSTHTASVMAMVTRIAISQSFKGPLFALAGVFAFVTMYDAFNVRLACGRAIDRVNQLIDKTYDADDPEKPEQVPASHGHTFAEVAVGFLIGVAVGVVYTIVETHIMG